MWRSGNEECSDCCYRYSGPFSCSSYLQKKHTSVMGVSVPQHQPYHLPVSHLPGSSPARSPAWSAAGAFPWQWNRRFREKQRSGQSPQGPSWDSQASRKSKALRTCHENSRPGTEQIALRKPYPRYPTFLTGSTHLRSHSQ